MDTQTLIIQGLLIIISMFYRKTEARKNSHYLVEIVDTERTREKPVIGAGKVATENAVRNVTEGPEYSEDYADDYAEDYGEAEDYEDEVPIAYQHDGFLKGLRYKLGLAPVDTVFRSKRDKKKQEKAELKMNSLVVSSLITKKESSKEALKTCSPASLTKWKKSNEKQADNEINTANQQEGSTCDVKIPDLEERGSNVDSWDHLNIKLKEDSELLSLFPKGIRPPTLSLSFRNASKVIADKYLIEERIYENVLAKIAFFKEHPDVNEVLLDYAVTIAMLSRTDMSGDIPNPIEIDDVFFDKPNARIEAEAEEDEGSDYSLYISGSHNLPGKSELSGDPEENKMAYHREDSLFHAFHALFHKVWAKISRDRNFPRAYELFYHTHQQMLRRAAVERFLLGLEPVVPLDNTEFRKSLGPGYKKGWYSWGSLGGRKDNCLMTDWDDSAMDRHDRLYEDIKKQMYVQETYEEFARYMEPAYHSGGHLLIARGCSSTYDAVAKTGLGIMAYSEVSARDPIFYRWHSHIENVVQDFRDKRLESYKPIDFKLSDGLEVASVNTLLDKNLIFTTKDVKNCLITHWENANIKHDVQSTITYTRINHINFKYQIHTKNLNQVKKKVIIRLWLGISKDEGDISQYDPKLMIAMDRFVHTLSGAKDETIERDSIESALTMKEQGSTLKKLMNDIQNKVETSTWCGLPHHLLVPRSKDYNPNEADLGGGNFVLLAFVNDVNQDVIEGSDGIEHMLCGHKNLQTKIDERSFGFPFDRKISFDMHKNHKFVAGSIVKIMFRSDQHQPNEIGVKLNELEDVAVTTTTTVSITIPTTQTIPTTATTASNIPSVSTTENKATIDTKVMTATTALNPFSFHQITRGHNSKTVGSTTNWWATTGWTTTTRPQRSDPWASFLKWLSKRLSGFHKWE